MCGEAQNPKKWRFTWEAQSHHPTLKLFLFNPSARPVDRCGSLRVQSNPARSTIDVSFTVDSEHDVSLLVPIPRVLIDCDSPVSFRTLDDHIEVKLALLLPVDHPVMSNLQSMLSLSEDGGEALLPDAPKRLSTESDLEKLSSKGSVDFYCRSCSAKLTRSPISCFLDSPSINWQEVADNWFGACCCSFGGISEKLVTRYARSYAPSKGRCLLTSRAVIICKDDLLNCEFPEDERSQSCEYQPLLADEDDNQSKVLMHSGSNHATGPTHVYEGKLKSMHLNDENLPCEAIGADLDSTRNETLDTGCCLHRSHSLSYEHEGSMRDTSKDMCRHFNPPDEFELPPSQRYFLNGFLGDVFMAKSHNISTAIEWVEFSCPRCSTLLGAYPCADSCAPLDNGVRFYKCCVSTGLPLEGSDDLFKEYTLERMFSNQILENAKDDLSFRTVVRDMKTKSPLLQIVLLNPNCWFSTGYCFAMDNPPESATKLNLHPVIKVLFNDCRDNTLFSSKRTNEEWGTTHSADEVFMLMHQMEVLIANLASAKDVFPPSMVSFQGLTLSLIQR
ncbi:uncharacterized protein LOC115741281 isoform X2 [Rhodamnia argentea]|uniref:Uncharacterized protein LOC115741281 isoform X2 n=1 Tax=Rhodamnia argentea TaxID=178133 RepID=A0A8B8P881_9MYRT|nr:uncharacterized protein LOC115741281 isoform X2 [Rhodamnia argentea]